MAESAFFWLSFAIFLYFVFYAVTTFGLICRSLYETVLTGLERGRQFTPPERMYRPGISLIAPAYNMAPLIAASARALLAADYDPLEVVIVDDGSEDGTTAALDAAFDLVELPVGDRMKIPTQPVLRYFVSRREPRLRVLQKENGGRSDAVNAGLNVAHLELVAIVDADTLLERDALKRIVEVFAADPDNVVAVGGNVRVANGALIENNAVAVPHVARGGTEASQTAEYLRSFLGARIAWSAINGLVIISGAFGVFRRDLIRDGGGLSLQTLGEDMEMVMRLHHQLRPQRPGTRIVHAADANAWTEIPSGLGPLRGQRIRWQVGLFDNLRIHWRMIGRRRFGAAGLWALPYALLFEAVGPLLQLTGIVFVVVLVGLHAIDVGVRGLAARGHAARRAAADRRRDPDRGGRVPPLHGARPDGARRLGPSRASLVPAAERNLASLGDRARAARAAARLGHDPARRGVQRNAGSGAGTGAVATLSRLANPSGTHHVCRLTAQSTPLEPTT